MAVQQHWQAELQQQYGKSPPNSSNKVDTMGDWPTLLRLEGAQGRYRLHVPLFPAGAVWKGRRAAGTDERTRVRGCAREPDLAWGVKARRADPKHPVDRLGIVPRRIIEVLKVG
ncbi:hypothetical protein BV22DRAFT_909200 [Leucogyrophana mollusca]|uniref:Uncharacterized protein n=1 Tax=Leucogyrophana mollusca TaxID=85980 RepID=A0ACB8AYF7_9AGAM|nr:hypothetical protein BV22DRAFT_909200 [Leucogyrophana mollusca]